MKLCHLQENGNGNHHVKLNKPDWEKQVFHVLLYGESRPKKKEKEKNDTSV
jgi:hypothetical protein